MLILHIPTGKQYAVMNGTRLQLSHEQLTQECVFCHTDEVTIRSFSMAIAQFDDGIVLQCSLDPDAKEQFEQVLLVLSMSTRQCILAAVAEGEQVINMPPYLLHSPKQFQYQFLQAIRKLIEVYPGVYCGISFNAPSRHTKTYSLISKEVHDFLTANSFELAAYDILPSFNHVEPVDR